MSRLQDVLIRGLRIDQPLPTEVSPGTVYVVIDENFLQEQSDGSFWEQFGPTVGGAGALPYLDLAENIPVDPPADTARLYALDVNGFTAVEVRDAAANVVRLASDNILIGKVSVAGGVARGQIVFIAGAVGANPLLGLAKADAIATMPTVGMAMDPGANNAFIRVLVSGTLQLLNTSAFTEGDSLFVSPVTAGAMTTVLPTAPAFAQRVGFVTRAHATQGEVLILTTGVDGPPRLHAPTHAAGGTDAVTVTSLAGYPGGTLTFLRADGSFAAPATSADTGRLLGVRFITTPGAGTYTPTAGTASIILELVGGGGGGGAVPNPGGGNVHFGTGGGGGAWLMKRLTANFAGAAYTVGAKGLGGAAGANNGTAGGATTFISTGGSPTTYTAGGGTAGGRTGNFAPPLVAFPINNGGVATNGDLNVSGGACGPAMCPNVFASQTSQGGSSRYAGNVTGSGIGADASAVGGTATGYGGGGGGAVALGTGIARAGGNGSDGLIIIYEFS